MGRVCHWLSVVLGAFGGGPSAHSTFRALLVVQLIHEIREENVAQVDEAWNIPQGSAMIVILRMPLAMVDDG